MWLRSGSASHTGRVRATNEDLALVSPDLVAVADGMGGHLGGEVAARTAIEELLAAFRRDRSTAGLVAAVERANRAIWQRSRTHRNLRGMGTTLTAAALVGGADAQRVAIVNVGDSRAYLFEPAYRRLSKLTEDHSVVEEMVRQGELTEAEAAVHPHRHILTRALGVEHRVEVDAWELDVAPGQRILLCSDGLTNELGEEEIGAVLSDVADPRAAAATLVRDALRHGGSDNVTAVVVDVLAGTDERGDEWLIVPLPRNLDEGTTARRDLDALGRARRGARERASQGDGRPGDVTAAVPAAREPAPAPSAPRSSVRPPPAAGVAPPVLRASPGGARRLVLVADPPRVRDPILTARVVAFLLLLVAVLGGTAGVVIWFDRASFFVGLEQGRVAVFQGRPGGLLWFRPTLVETTALTLADVPPTAVAALRAGVEEASFSAALAYVHDLEAASATPGSRGSSTAATGSGTAATGSGGRPAAMGLSATAAARPAVPAGALASLVTAPAAGTRVWRPRRRRGARATRRAPPYHSPRRARRHGMVGQRESAAGDALVRAEEGD
jgi:serine/threonine protein phosphatase PrpC